MLDGDFPPDPAEFHFISDLDPNDVTLDMMRQKVFLKRLNIWDGDSDSDSDSEGVPQAIGIGIVVSTSSHNIPT